MSESECESSSPSSIKSSSSSTQSFSLPRRQLQPELDSTTENEDEANIVKNLEEETVSSMSLRFTEKKFKTMHSNFMKGDDLHNAIHEDFKGYSKEDVTLLLRYSDKTSEKLYKIYKAISHTEVETVFHKKDGFIKFGGKGARTKAFIIYKKIFDQKTAIPVKKASTTRRKTTRTKVSANKGLKRKRGTIRDSTGKDLDPGNVSARTSRKKMQKLAVSAGGRIIQTPKRYLDGMKIEKPSKRPRPPGSMLEVSKDKSLFQIGMLPPKYPKMEEEKILCRTGSYVVPNDEKSSPKKTSINEQPSDSCNGWFEISRLQLTGELNDIISLFVTNEARRQEQELILKEERQQRKTADVNSKQKFDLKQQRKTADVNSKQNFDLKQQRKTADVDSKQKFDLVRWNRIQKELDNLEKHVIDEENGRTGNQQMKWGGKSNLGPISLFNATPEEFHITQSVKCTNCSRPAISTTIPKDTVFVCRDCLRKQGFTGSFKAEQSYEKYTVEKSTPTHIPIYTTISRVPVNHQKGKWLQYTDEEKAQNQRRRQQSLLISKLTQLSPFVTPKKMQRKRNPTSSRATFVPTVVIPPGRNLKKRVTYPGLTENQNLLSKITGGKLGRKLNVQSSVIKSLNALQKYMNGLLCDRRNE